MLLSAAATSNSVSTLSLSLLVNIKNAELRFLVDSGSTHSFLDSSLHSMLPDITDIKAVTVKVAGGGKLTCSQQVKQCQWSCQGQEFSHDFRLLSLGGYDGILGLDWLAKHSPMYIDWEQKWLSFQYKGVTATLQGDLPEECAFTVMAIFQNVISEQKEQLPEIQALLDKYAVVFSPPTGLPPRRQYDHSIPLIPGAQPVSIRPYKWKSRCRKCCKGE